MKGFLFFTLFSSLSAIIPAQQSWSSNFKIYTGLGLGIGKLDKSLSAFDNLRKINHSIPFINLEYQNNNLPFSIDYEFTISNYVRKMENAKSTSQYSLHKVGIGFRFQENVILKIKYLLNNHFDEYTEKRNLGVHTSLGVENSFLLGGITKNKNLNIAYRLMIYFEQTFGDLSVKNQSNLSFFKVNSPYRSVIGVSLSFMPWTSLKPMNNPGTILPPFIYINKNKSNS